ncbi:MAG: hypothetical protein N2447_04800 [Thermoanaerobaculum sp.]|nr:hypothetical protein [Thermoanaerobaculum sp.]
MRRLLWAVALLAVGTQAWAAVVVFKGGKKLEVSSFERRGNYLLVVLADGKKASYPLSAVDLEATAQANGQPTPPTEVPKAESPRSPFAKAIAKPGAPAASLSDADVQKVAPTLETTGAGGEKQAAEPTGREEGVVVLGWSGREAGEGKWEITASLLNQGKVAVQNVVVAVRSVAEGQTVATGSATFPGPVAPGQPFTVAVTLAAPEPPKQVVFSLTWQQVNPVPSPPATPVPATPQASPPPAS